MLDDRLKTVAKLTADNPAQRANLVPLKRHIDAKLAELHESIEVRRAKGMADAVALVASNRGKVEMDAIRAQLDAMAREELRLRQVRLDEMAQASHTAITSGIVSGLLGAVLTIAIFVLLLRNGRARVRRDWLQAGQVGLGTVMRGDKSVEQLGDAILVFLAEHTGARGGALFKGEGGQFRRVATLGVPADADMTSSFALKEGLLGQVAADGRPVVIHDVPDRLSDHWLGVWP